MQNIFTHIECLDIINKANQLNNWKRNQKNDEYSYYVCDLELDINYTDIIKKYANQFLNLNIKNVKVAVLKYIPGDFFGEHTDNNQYSDFTHDFLYNLNVRLNDDYIGGEFYLNGEEFTNEVGKLYHYESTIPHEVKPIISGIRYSALFYIRTRDLNHKISLL